MKCVVSIALLCVLFIGCAEERALPYADTTPDGVHPSGYAKPDSADFHGKDLERRGWDFALCQGCHGESFAGKGTAPSCLSCHAKGPTACSTCHGDPPTTGAHAAHGAKGLACTECHTVPASWAEHRKPTTGQPLVTFGAFAQTAGATPTWNMTTGTCTNVYCHGGTLGDAAATNTQPAWAGGPVEATCGTCHGAPPATHAQTACASCHQNATHIDGKLDVATTCAGGCHGNAQSPAPSTGAHKAHLQGGFFSQPIACAECHLVPATVTSPGHIDSLAPAELTFDSLASARGATPTWSENSATCTNVYCHGPLAPAWTESGTTAAYCGGCHGLPPTDAAHNSTMKLTDCATCHPETVGPFANILVSGGKHINGVVDAQ